MPTCTVVWGGSKLGREWPFRRECAAVPPRPTPPPPPRHAPHSPRGPGAEECPARPRTVTSKAIRPLWPSTGCMLVGSPTMQSEGGLATFRQVDDQPPGAGAIHFLVIGDEKVDRLPQPGGLEHRHRGKAAGDRSPFISAVPRPNSLPSSARSLKGSALQAWPSTGTVSTCPGQRKRRPARQDQSPRADWPAPRPRRG